MGRYMYLPYYRVSVRGGQGPGFYIEARLSSLLPPVRVFLLATPRDPGFEQIPSVGRRLDPLPPESVEAILDKAMSEIVRLAYSGGESFDVGGIKGLLRLAFSGLLGRREEVSPTPVLEARLALDYVRDVLGVEPGDRLSITGTPLWLRINIEPEGIYLPSGDRFRVLERLVSEHGEVRRLLYHR